jgi:hypothetical protein
MPSNAPHTDMVRNTLQCALFLAVLFAQTAIAQSYVNSPLYQLGERGGPGLHRRWSGPPTDANGTTTTISMSGDVGATGGNEEGMRVEGAPGSQILHWFVSFYRPRVTFGYDLFLEPVVGTNKIRCTFRTLTDPENWSRDKSSQLVPLPEPLTPVEIEDGATLSISFLPEGDPKRVFVQQLRITLLKKSTSRSDQGSAGSED